MELYRADDVAQELGISRNKAYELMRMLNQELKNKGYVVINGRIPKAYLLERFYHT